MVVQFFYAVDIPDNHLPERQAWRLNLQRPFLLLHLRRLSALLSWWRDNVLKVLRFVRVDTDYTAVSKLLNLPVTMSTVGFCKSSVCPAFAARAFSLAVFACVSARSACCCGVICPPPLSPASISRICAFLKRSSDVGACIGHKSLQHLCYRRILPFGTAACYRH